MLSIIIDIEHQVDCELGSSDLRQPTALSCHMIHQDLAASQEASLSLSVVVLGPKCNNPIPGDHISNTPLIHIDQYRQTANINYHQLTVTAFRICNYVH